MFKKKHREEAKEKGQRLVSIVVDGQDTGRESVRFDGTCSDLMVDKVLGVMVEICMDRNDFQGARDIKNKIGQRMQP